MKTVRDIKRFVVRESRVPDYHAFYRLSDRHLAFWRCLNEIGKRGIPADPTEDMPPDIDAAAVVTEREREELLAEFVGLYAGIACS